MLKPAMVMAAILLGATLPRYPPQNSPRGRYPAELKPSRGDYGQPLRH